MENCKPVKNSQFNFEYLSPNSDLSKPKIGTKGSTNSGSLLTEKPRLAPLSGQNRYPGNPNHEKFKLGKNASPLPGLYNDKKTPQSNIKGQHKKPTGKVASSSPLTITIITTPNSSQPRSRQSELFEPKPKVFRVRTGSSQSKLNSENSGVRSNSVCNRENSLQREISVNSFDNSDQNLNLEKNKNHDLTRITLAPITKERETLPLLIIHFEGIIGSCLVQAKDENKESKNKEDTSSPHQFVMRKGVKRELKALSKNFLVMIVFPSLHKKYMHASKYLIENKFCIDAIYYNTKSDKIKDLQKIEDLTLNYNLVLNDFGSKLVEQKIILLLPLNMSTKLAKHEFLSGNSINDLSSPLGPKNYEGKQFLCFFPKIKANINNLRIICVPNFTLSEKNEKPANLLKSTFIGVARMIESVHHEMTVSSCPNLNIKGHQKDAKSLSPAPLSSISLNQLDNNREPEHNRTESCKDIEEEQFPQILENQENKIQNKSTFSVFDMNTEELLVKLEKELEKNRQWQKIRHIKQRVSSSIGQEPPTEFDLASMRQKIIEELLEAQKYKGYVRGNIMHYFLVGDLFSRNNHLFKFYEKDDFYSKKAYEKVKEISKGLKNRFREEEKHDNWHRRERLAFESAPLRANVTATEGESKGTDDEPEGIDLLLIKRQAKIMQLYIDE